MLTAEFVRARLSYDAATGVLTWVASRRRDLVGRTAGYADKLGYIRIHLDGKNYLAHRIAWLLMTGDWPKDEVDHINGRPNENRWSNLREATRSQQSWNSAKPSDNTSGYKGVTFSKRKRKWQAQAKVAGRQTFLGYFDDPISAARAYERSAVAAFGDFACTDR